MRHGLRVVPASGQALGEIGKARGGLGGDVLRGAAGTEALGCLPRPAQALADLGVAQVLQLEDVAFAGRAGEMGVDFDALAVADDEQRRVVQRQRVGHELAQRGGQVAPRGLVFPGEAAALPHVGPAVFAAGFFQAALEAVGLGVGGFWHIQEPAQVDEMRLRAGALGQAVGRAAGGPFGDEGLRGHQARVAPGVSPGSEKAPALRPRASWAGQVREARPSAWR